MLELGHKERNLLSGIGVQIAIVMVMVFAYTQAMRQVKLQRGRLTQLQEQLAVAREELAKRKATHAVPSQVEQELTELKSSWAAPEGVLSQVGELEKLVREGHGLSEFRVKAGREPADQIQIPLDGGQPIEIQLYPLEISGYGTSRAIGGLLAHLAAPGSKPVRILAGLELRGAGDGRPEPVQFSAKYRIPAVAGSPAGPFPAPEKPELAWGPREEPFLSPLEVTSAARFPAEKLKEMHLSGIVREGADASCVINGRILKPGDWVKEYQVVLITEDSVLLQGAEDELLLRLP